MHIELRNVSHDFELETGFLPVLENLSFSVPKGKFTAIVGPSGCGKSTITRLVSGLLKSKKGEVFISNEIVNSPKSTVGMAFQNPVLLEWRNILDNVILPLEIVSKSMNKVEKINRARELLSLVGLAEFEKSRPSELSGGMKQRASLCRALIHEPEVLMLDEPFGALDAFTREELWCVLRDLWHEHKFTVLLVTHDLIESAFLADRVLVMSNRPGRVIMELEVPFERPRNLDIRFEKEFVDIVHQLRDQIRTARAA